MLLGWRLWRGGRGWGLGGRAEEGDPGAGVFRREGDDANLVAAFAEEGDVVIFSSRIIPGNEKPIGKLQNALVRLGVEIVTYQMPTKIAADGVTAAHVYDTEGHEKTWGCDATVLVTQRRSNEALFRELKDAVGLDALKAEGVEALYRIGDCEAPRLIADAVFSGHRLAREIDTDNPAVALPFKRERRVPDEASLERDLEELRARREREAVPA